MTAFKTNLRDLRKEKKLTQQQLAELAGISRDSVKRLERQDQKNPSYSAMYFIARYFEQPVESIFWFEET